MKFHCDRCKTRYSIADERVRGKILKIRCKNCSSVITVKESGPVSGPGPARLATSAGDRSSRSGARRRPSTSSGSALQGAFEEALRRPESVSDIRPAAVAPAVLEAEWFVSQDGEQFGPFTLQKAQSWVSARPPDDDLYCWSEGFDDWLPVERVSHFRGLRGPAPAGRNGSSARPLPGPAAGGPASGSPHAPRRANPAEQPPETPVPLFAATLAQVVADAPTEVERGPGMFTRKGGSPASPLGLPSSRPPGANGPAQPAGNGSSLFPSAPASNSRAPGQGETAHEASLDLEIGEASRVVKLPMLAHQVGQAAPMGAPGLPGIGGVAPGASPLGRGTGSYDQSAHSVASGPLAGLPVVRGGTAEVPRLELLPPARRRSGLVMPIAIASAVLFGVVSVLLYVALSGDDEDALLRRGQVGGKGGLAYQFGGPQGKKAEDKQADAPRGGTRRVARRNPRVAGGTTAAATIPVAPGSSDEVDLSGGEQPAGELDPNDLVDVYSANKIGVTMCYNSALKRDPLLSVRRADVLISVSPAGSVSSVSIPSLSGTPLGVCLEKRIRSWKFPRATRVFTSQFPIIFQT